jgi:hypothetical protein
VGVFGFIASAQKNSYQRTKVSATLDEKKPALGPTNNTLKQDGCFLNSAKWMGSKC